MQFWKSVNIWRSYGQKFGVLFFTHSVQSVSLCRASFVSSQRDATRVCCWAPARLQHGARSYRSILRPAGHSAANPQAAVAAADRWDRQADRYLIDGRRPDRYIDSAPHCMRAAWINCTVNLRHKVRTTNLKYLQCYGIILRRCVMRRSENASLTAALI